MVVVGERAETSFQLPVYLVCLGGLAFRRAFLPEVGVTNSLVPTALCPFLLSTEIFYDEGFPSRFLTADPLDVERGRKRTSLCFHNSKIFVSKGRFTYFLPRAMQNKAKR